MRHPYNFGALALVIALSVSAANVFSGELLTSSRPKPKPTTTGVTWSLVEEELSGKPGETVVVHISGVIPEGWHTYTLKKYKFGPQSTVVAVEPKGVASLVEESVTYDPQPYIEQEATKIFGTQVDAFKGKVTMALPLKIAATATGDSVAVSLKVTSAICDESNCLPKQTIELTPVVSLKKKVSSGDPTFKHTGHSEIDWALADQHEKLASPAGGMINLTVEGMIKYQWHTYDTKQDPKLKFVPVTKFSIEPADAFSIAGEVTSDRPAKVVVDDTLPGGARKVNIFEDKVRFTIPVRVDPMAPCGAKKLILVVTSQACKEQCKQIHAEFASTIDIQGQSIAGTGQCAPSETKSAVDFSQGLLAFLLSAAAAGAISLLTPCVFPMIPITVSFFTKRNHVSHARAVRDALIFSSGIIFTYVGLAFFLEFAFGKNIRELATNPWMNLAIFGIFVALACSLFGLFELQLPSGLINSLNKSAHGGDSVFGLLLMGLVFTLTSFSCTGPFVGTVMLTAVNGDWVWPLLGMTVFATVFALPFFVLALFPTALKSLPKSGGWLNSVKVVMGFVEIAAALKFLSSADLVWHWGILTHTVFVSLWIFIALLTAFYILGVVRFPHDTPLKKRGTARIAFATLFFVVAGLLISDLAGNKATLGEFVDTFFPPREYPPSVTDDWDSGIAAAKRSGKPAFFDFTGLTCVNCRKMENSMFTKKEVEDLLKNYVVVRLYTDAANSEEEKARSARNAKEQEIRFKQATLPFYAIVAPDGKVLDTFPEGYTEDVDKFTQFLKRGIPTQAIGQQANAQNQSTAQN